MKYSINNVLWNCNILKLLPECWMKKRIIFIVKKSEIYDQVNYWSPYFEVYLGITLIYISFISISLHCQKGCSINLIRCSILCTMNTLQICSRDTQCKWKFAHAKCKTEKLLIEWNNPSRKNVIYAEYIV